MTRRSRPTGVVGHPDTKPRKRTSVGLLSRMPTSRPNGNVVKYRDFVPGSPLEISFRVAQASDDCPDLRRGPFDEYLLAQGAYGFRVDESKVVPEFLVHLSNNKNFRHILKQNLPQRLRFIFGRQSIWRFGFAPPSELQREFARRVIAVGEAKDSPARVAGGTGRAIRHPPAPRLPRRTVRHER